MAENYEFRPVLAEMLSAIPDTMDKREGSIIYDTLAPVAFEIAKQNYMISTLMNLLFPDTADEDWLDRNADNFGLERKPATYAARRIVVTDTESTPMEVPLGSRLRIEDLSLKVTEKASDGEYLAVAEQAGTLGNRYTGELLPVNNISGLGTAMLGDVVIAAADIETDDALRERLYDYLRKTPFGGNVADYEQKVLAIEGVGAVAVFTAQDMGAGVVRLIIADEQLQPASDELIETVEGVIIGNRSGTGTAPIGHLVTVRTTSPRTIDVAATVRLKTGASFAVVEPLIRRAAEDYIAGIGFKDGIVYLARLTAQMLGASPEVLDISGVTMNGLPANLQLTKAAYEYQTPVAGEITLEEAVG